MFNLVFKTPKSLKQNIKMWLRAERKFVHLTNATFYTLGVSNNKK